MMYRFTGMPGPFCETEDTKAYKQTETTQCVQDIRQAKPRAHRYENEGVLDCSSIPIVTKTTSHQYRQSRGKDAYMSRDSH